MGCRTRNKCRPTTVFTSCVSSIPFLTSSSECCVAEQYHYVKVYARVYSWDLASRVIWWLERILFIFIVPYFRVCNPHQTILYLAVKSGCGSYANCAFMCGFTAVHAALPLSHTLRQNSPPSKVSLSLRKPNPITTPAFQTSLLSSFVVAYYPLFRSPFRSLAVLVVGK